MFIVCSTKRNGFHINWVKLWTFFWKFYMVSIKFKYAAPFSQLKLLQSSFLRQALLTFWQLFFILWYVRCDFCFANAFLCCFSTPHSVFPSVSHRRSFHPYYRHDQSHWVRLKFHICCCLQQQEFVFCPDKAIVHRFGSSFWVYSKN